MLSMEHVIPKSTNKNEQVKIKSTTVQKKDIKCSPIPLHRTNTHPFDILSEETLQRKGLSESSEVPQKDEVYFQELLEAEALRRLQVNRKFVDDVRAKYLQLQESPDSPEAVQEWVGFQEAMAMDKKLLEREKKLLELIKKCNMKKAAITYTESSRFSIDINSSSRGSIFYNINQAQLIESNKEALSQVNSGENALIQQYSEALQFVYMCRAALNEKYPVSRIVDSSEDKNFTKKNVFYRVLRSCDNADTAFDEAENKMIKGDIPLHELDMIVEEVMKREGITPESKDAYSIAVNNWLDDKKSFDNFMFALKMAVPIAAGIALCFVPLTSIAGIIILSVGTTSGIVGASYELEKTWDLNDVGKASKAGPEKLVDPEEAEWNYLMAQIDMGLAMIDLIVSGVDIGFSILKLSKAARVVPNAINFLSKIDSQQIMSLMQLKESKLIFLLDNLDDLGDITEIIHSKNLVRYFNTLSDEVFIRIIKTGPKNLSRNLVKASINAAESQNGLILKSLESGNIVGGIYKKEYLEELISFHDNIDDVLAQFNMSKADFQKLKTKRIDQLTVEEQTIMIQIRELVPHPTKETLLQKVVPWDDIDYYLRAEDPWEISGFIAKASDGAAYASFDDIMESFRLQYSWTDEAGNFHAPFITSKKQGKGYGLIRFKATNIDDISVPYGKAMGGTAKDPHPCTLTGFSGGRNGSIMPEYVVPRDTPLTLLDGAEFYTVSPDGIETLIAIFDASKQQFVLIKK